MVSSVVPEKLQKFSPGDRVTLAMRTYFGGIVLKKATFLGNVREDGYINGNGSWALYPFRNGAGETCFKFDVRFYKKRTNSSVRWKFAVEDIKIGWED